MVILNIGMPRSGTLWRYKLVRDLVIAAGGKDGAQIRKQYLLHPFYWELNSHIDTLSNRRLPISMYPSFLGETYVLNTHANPTKFVIRNMEKGRIKAVYGFRDPRDCILSMLDYGKKDNPNLSSTQFQNLKSLEQAADYMQTFLNIWEQWTAIPETLVLKYEDQLEDYDNFLKKIVDYLDMDIAPELVDQVIAQYPPREPAKDGARTHFSKGIAHRYKTEFNPEQQAYLIERFGPVLEKMGYET